MEKRIRPSADLKNHYADISKTCKESHQPVIITVNGQADTVILSLQDYRQMHSDLELLRMLADSESDVSANRIAPIEGSFRNLRTRLFDSN